MTRFDACPPGSRACVSSLNDGGYAGMDPVPFRGSGDDVLDVVVDVVEGLPRTEVVERRGTYLRTEFTSRWLRFTDTVEFEVDTATNLLHFRSESVSFARNDLGANRTRMREVTGRLRERLGG